MTRPIDLEDLCVWPDGTYCQVHELECMTQGPCAKSDDYEIYSYDSIAAACITGALEDGCKALYGHEFWQIISDDEMVELGDYLGIIIRSK